jgi:isocitrate dehydrogenase (NAD+)
VLVMPNLYGDIVSDLDAGLVGGLGVAPGANIGVNAAVFEGAHCSTPDIAGKGIANPLALTLSAAMMLSYLNEAKAAQKLETAIKKVLICGEDVTPDIKPG